MCKDLFLRLIVKKVQGSCQIPFSSCWAWLWYIIRKVNSTDSGLNLKNIISTLCLRGWELHVKSAFSKKLWPVLWCLDYSAPLDFPIYGSDSWKRHFKRCLSLYSRERGGELIRSREQVNSMVERFAWGLNHHMVVGQPTKGEPFFMGRELIPLDIMLSCLTIKHGLNSDILFRLLWSNPS